MRPESQAKHLSKKCVVVASWPRPDESAALNQPQSTRNFIEENQKALKGKKPVSGNSTAYLQSVNLYAANVEIALPERVLVVNTRVCSFLSFFRGPGESKMETFAPKGKVFGPILPQFVLEKPITFGAKIMYALLCNYASEKDHCWPSQATLATRLSCSLSSVKNYLGELVKEKLITIRREQYRASVYYLLNPGDLRGQSKADGQQPKVDGGEPNSGYLNNLSKQKEKNPPLPPTKPETPKVATAQKPPTAGGVSSLASDFETAFALYPKKDAKAFAWIAWCKLYRNDQLPQQEELLTAIRHSAASESWQRENGRFVPQMSNWLRGQRWRDPLSPAEEQERQRRHEANRALLAQQEEEKRRQEQWNERKARVKPFYDAFAARFMTPFNEAMAFGTWMHLHSKELAPLSQDVPADNALGIIGFMNAFKRKREEAQYRARHAQPEVKRLDVRTSELMSCGEALRRNPVLSQLFSGNEQLRQAV